MTAWEQIDERLGTWWQQLSDNLMTVFGQLGNKQRPSTLESDWQCLSSFESHNLMIGACCILNDIQRYKPWYFCIKCFKFLKAISWCLELGASSSYLEMRKSLSSTTEESNHSETMTSISILMNWVLLTKYFCRKIKEKRPPLAAINCFVDSYLNSKKIYSDGIEIPSLSIRGRAHIT